MGIDHYYKVYVFTIQIFKFLLKWIENCIRFLYFNCSEQCPRSQQKAESVLIIDGYNHMYFSSKPIYRHARKVHVIIHMNLAIVPLACSTGAKKWG